MGQEEEEQQQEGEEAPPPSSDATSQEPSTQTSPPPPPFDPSRMIGIIKRKALIKELAAAYHAECLAYCQEILELQRKSDEPFIDLKPPEDLKKEIMRPPKRLKKPARH
ncbi:unnamed protein product [Malus baccata var. baccata]|uniref:Uncharacterized protein n=1 Tax=Malus domestica TaxID=3750 RepID=A0A498JTY9_MALDO|nr:uncharacterized protein LOC103435164 [Malus domestica]XP_050148513.1 uncharacterized protein LOC126623610 [Malus sylvestris]RXH98940.1 hypothetical protein DVH24_011265 [Malus domestica]